jgi:hypothetical protein
VSRVTRETRGCGALSAASVARPPTDLLAVDLALRSLAHRVAHSRAHRVVALPSALRVAVAADRGTVLGDGRHEVALGDDDRRGEEADEAHQQHSRELHRESGGGRVGEGGVAHTCILGEESTTGVCRSVGVDRWESIGRDRRGTIRRVTAVRTQHTHHPETIRSPGLAANPGSHTPYTTRTVNGTVPYEADTRNHRTDKYRVPHSTTECFAAT